MESHQISQYILKKSSHIRYKLTDKRNTLFTNYIFEYLRPLVSRANVVTFYEVSVKYYIIG